MPGWIQRSEMTFEFGDEGGGVGAVGTLGDDDGGHGAGRFLLEAAKKKLIRIVRILSSTADLYGFLFSVSPGSHGVSLFKRTQRSTAAA
jgi:hypothetical protein